MLIPLSAGGQYGDGRMKYALIDAADYPLVQDRKWSAWSRDGRAFYAQTSPRRGTTVQMSRVLLGISAVEGVEADHRNHTTLDNRRSNLRRATPLENRQHQRGRRGSVSGLKGVKFHRSPRLRSKRWQASIQCAGVERSLGYFATPQEAAAAYDAAARALHGAFAVTNGR